MEFCIGICAKIDAVGLVKQAEDVGASHFGVGDGPLLFSDPYQYLALASRETSSIKLGTWVTNPLTRSAPVTANSIATLNALAPGRVFVGMGTANNALRSMGNRPATLHQLEQSLDVVQGLLKGDRVLHHWLNQDREIEFLDTNGHWYNIADPVDTWMAVGGPKGLALAARYADAITYCLGPQPGHDRPGPPRAGQSRRRSRPPTRVGQARSPTPGSTSYDRVRPGKTESTKASARVRSAPASSTPASWPNTSTSSASSIVTAAQQAAMAYLGDPTAVDAPHYLDVWAKYLRGLDPVHRPIITKELVDYWCLCGTPDQLREQTQLMLDAGVDMIGVMLANPFTAQRDIADIGSSILARA